MKLGEIDTVKESFTADVFIQARWREPRLDGRDNAEKQVRDNQSIWLPTELINVRIQRSLSFVEDLNNNI